MDPKPPFEQFDVIEVVERMKAGDVVRRLRITHEPELRDGFWYVGFESAEPSKDRWFGHGWGKFYLEPRPFGFVSWRVVDRQEPEPSPSYPNLKGNPAYDLMHDPDPRWR